MNERVGSIFEPILPVDVTAPIPRNALCQEASVYSREKYIPCGAPAVAIVKHDKESRAYFMCAPCTDHNVRNRGGKVLRRKKLVSAVSGDSVVPLLKKSTAMVKAGRRPLVSVPVDMPQGTIMDKDNRVVLPAEPGKCVDLLYRTREKRLSLQRELDRMSELESALKEYFINELPKDSTGLAGKVARVQIETKPIPVAEDWGKVYAYIKKHGAFDLLQRRLNESAIKERFEDHKQIPGIGIFNVKKVSCVKLK